jgi:ADP-ribosylation factor-like protein 2
MLSILRKARLKEKEMRILMLWVDRLVWHRCKGADRAVDSGLDNAGKTTIVKRVMDEDVTTVSPTLGFIIKTIDFQGLHIRLWQICFVADRTAATSWTYVGILVPGTELSLVTDTFHQGDVGGQKTLRSYWRNYFEKTDALIWVVDATDRMRVGACREELSGLLLEEVRFDPDESVDNAHGLSQRLMGASLLVFSNKTDVDGCMSDDEIRQVCLLWCRVFKWCIDSSERVSSSMRYTPTNGLFSDAAQWLEKT